MEVVKDDTSMGGLTVQITIVINPSCISSHYHYLPLHSFPPKLHLRTAHTLMNIYNNSICEKMASKIRKITSDEKGVLLKFYQAGMVGTGEHFKDQMKQCSTESLFKDSLSLSLSLTLTLTLSLLIVC